MLAFVFGPNDNVEPVVVDRLVPVPAIAGPFSVRVKPPTAYVPDVSVSVPPTISEDAILAPFASSSSRLLYVPVPFSVWAALPPFRYILPVPECVAPAAIVVFPLTVIVFPASAKVPALTVRLPCRIWAVPAVFVLALESVRLPYIAGMAEIVTGLVVLYVTVEVGARFILAVVKGGNVVVVVDAAPICSVAPAATVSVPVVLPPIWLLPPPSEKVPDVTARLLRIGVAPFRDAVMAGPTAIVRL